MTALVRIKYLFIYSCLILAAQANAEASANKCPAVTERTNLPYCPTSGNGLLGEEYPATSVVVSTTFGVEFAIKYIGEVLQASGKTPPDIYLAADTAGFNAVKTLIEKRGINAKLHQASDISWKWQQDYFEAFADLKTGRPVLRKVSGYPETDKPVFERLAAGVDQCKVQVGPPLKTGAKTESAHYGGNIEALPGGACVLGDGNLTSGQWLAYAKEICGSNQVLKAPTHFLSVGHTDEIFQTVRIPNESPPCNFAFLIASPNKGLQLIKEQPSDKFWHYDTPGALFQQVGNHLRYRAICRAYLNLLKEKEKPPIAAQGGRSVASQFRGFTDKEVMRCLEMRNGDFLRVISSDPGLSQYQNMIQTKMNRFRNDVTLFMKKQMPGCNPRIIDVPYLFQGRIIKNPQGHEIAKNEDGFSVFPNITNGSMIGDSFLLPEPVNPAFRTYMDKNLGNLGIKARFLETSEAHQTGGNLHCATHVIRECRPRK